MQYSIEYHTTIDGSTMVTEQFDAENAEEARKTARELLESFADEKYSYYAIYWTEGEDPEMIEANAKDELSEIEKKTAICDCYNHACGLNAPAFYDEPRSFFELVNKIDGEEYGSLIGLMGLEKGTREAFADFCDEFVATDWAEVWDGLRIE